MIKRMRFGFWIFGFIKATILAKDTDELTYIGLREAAGRLGIENGKSYSVLRCFLTWD